MSGWKNTDANANNKPSYIVHVGRDQNYTNSYIANTILVTTSRIANANSSFGVSTKATAHAGWVHFHKRTDGRVKSEVLVCLSNPSSANANAALPWFTGI